MAISFNGSQNFYKSVAGMPGGLPLSMFCRCLSNDTTGEGYPYQMLQNSLIDANVTPGFRGDRSGDPLTLRRGYPGQTSLLDGGTFSAGQWITYGVVLRASNDASQYINGTRYNTSVDVPYGGISDVSHGAFNVGSNSFSTFFNGAVCHAALWRVALTDEEFASLDKGFSPRRIRPQHLRYYMPGIRLAQDLSGGDGQPYVGSYGFTSTPRVYGP